MPHPPTRKSHRRPRPLTRPTPQCLLCTCSARAPLTPSYVLPPPVAAGVFAIVSVSVTVALNTLLSPNFPPFRPPTRPPNSPFTFLSRLARLLQAHVRGLVAPPRSAQQSSSRSSLPTPADDPFSRLDDVRDRAVAQLENERFALAAALSHEDYVTLPALQRRELLATAFAEIANAPPEPRAPAAVQTAATTVPKAKGKGVVQEKKGERFPFLKVAESVNGRAAALGFVLCLAREVAEPGHPSLVDQVVDVVVPLAQKTPPFLVAVVDQIVDLLT